MQVNEGLDQETRLAAARNAKAEGDFSAFVAARKAYYYVEKDCPQENDFATGFAAGRYEAYQTLSVNMEIKQGDELKKMMFDFLATYDGTAAHPTPEGMYITGFTKGLFDAMREALEVFSGKDMMCYYLVMGVSDDAIVEPLMKDISDMLNHPVDYVLSKFNNHNLMVLIHPEELKQIQRSGIVERHLGYNGVQQIDDQSL